MAWLGIQVDAAQLLSQALRRWQTNADDIASLVMQAESISDVPSQAVPLLDQIGSDGTSLAAQISRAVEELTSFRLSEFSTFEGIGEWRLPEHLRLSSVRHHDPLSPSERAQAESIVQRIADAIADHRVPYADDRRRLRELFETSIADESVAAAAHNLVLRGYPLSEAALMYHKDHIAAVYDHVAGAIESGTSPLDSGLPSGLFPVEYRRWHATTRELAAPYRELVHVGVSPARVTQYLDTHEPIISERENLRLGGFAGQTFAIEADGSASEFAAASATAAWGGRTTSTWFGDALAPLFTSADATQTAQIGEALSEDAPAALAFMNELGVAQVGRIPATLARRGQDLLQASLPDYSAALASVSGHDDLRFTGADLVAADLGRPDAPQGVRPELLLLAPGHDADFAIDAAAASLQLRGDDYNNWSGWSAQITTDPTDPRTIALQAIITNGLAGAFVQHLSENGQLRNLIHPQTGFAGDPNVTDSESQSPLSVVVALAGNDHAATTAVTSYLHQIGHYAMLPVGEQLGGPLEGVVRDLRTIDDARLVNGLSVMLTLAAARYVDGPTDVGHYVAAQLGSPYFSSYHTVLLSGSGDHLFNATDSMLARAIYEQAAAGATTLNLGSLNHFIGVVAGVRGATHLHDAKLEDRAASNLSRTFSLIGLGVGVPGAAAATSVSAAASATSLVTGNSNAALAQAEAQLEEVLDRGAGVRAAGMIALFASRRVRTADGKQVTLVGLEPGRELALRIADGSAGEPPHRMHPLKVETFGELPAEFISTPPFAELRINDVPLKDLLGVVESADTSIDGADAEVTKRFND